MFAKQPAEVELVIVADDLRNLVDGIIGLFQKNLRIVDAQRYDKLHRCHAGVFLEVPDKPAHTHAPCLGESSILIS